MDMSASAAPQYRAVCASPMSAPNVIECGHMNFISLGQQNYARGPCSDGGANTIPSNSLAQFAALRTGTLSVFLLLFLNRATQRVVMVLLVCRAQLCLLFQFHALVLRSALLLLQRSKVPRSIFATNLPILMPTLQSRRRNTLDEKSSSPRWRRDKMKRMIDTTKLARSETGGYQSHGFC